MHLWQAAKMLPNKYRLSFYACFEVALINQALHYSPVMYMPVQAKNNTALRENGERRSKGWVLCCVSQLHA